MVKCFLFNSFLRLLVYKLNKEVIVSFFLFSLNFIFCINVSAFDDLAENRQAEETVMPADHIDIEEVIERPLSDDEGPYVKVKEFSLLDVVDIPEFGVYIKEIHESILKPNLDKQQERGFSIGELQSIADELSNYYRLKGFILATSVIPVQTVENGIVNILVYIGRLGRVIVDGNEKYHKKIIMKPFSNLIDKPIRQKDIEQVLFEINSFPGLSVTGLFQPGQIVGKSDLVVKVHEEKSFDITFYADNHGLSGTGRNRIRPTLNLNNFTGFADKLGLSYQQSYNPKNSNFWVIDYTRNLLNSFVLGLSASGNNSFSMNDDRNTEVSTTNRFNELFLSKAFVRSRQSDLIGKLSISKQQSKTRADSIRVNEDSLTVLGLELDYNYVDSFSPLNILNKIFNQDIFKFGGGLNFVNIRYNKGFNNFLGSMGSSVQQLTYELEDRSARRGGSGEYAEGSFDRINLDYRRVQLLTENQSIFFRAEVQWSDDLLTSLSQYSVGGPGNVRGYPFSQALFDRAYFLSIAYVVNAPFFADKKAFRNHSWGELLSFSIFYDFVTGKQNDPLNDDSDTYSVDNWSTFRSIGFGVDFNLPSELKARLIYAVKLGNKTTRDNKSGRLWLDFSYFF